MASAQAEMKWVYSREGMDRWNQNFQWMDCMYMDIKCLKPVVYFIMVFILNKKYTLSCFFSSSEPWPKIFIQDLHHLFSMSKFQTALPTAINFYLFILIIILIPSYRKQYLKISNLFLSFYIKHTEINKIQPWFSFRFSSK